MSEMDETSETRRRTRVTSTATSVVAAMIGIVVGLALAGTAEACPVCFQAKTDASRVAFIATTGFMTALPLLLVGALVWWVRRQFIRSQRAGLPRAAYAPDASGAPVHDDAPIAGRAAGRAAGLPASR